MYRKLASAVLVASAISAQYAVAVNLGEMTMLSALNEPLKAEIRLRNVGDLDPSQIRISFASAEEFAEAGFERTYFHGNVEFDVELDSQGNGVIKLNSERRLNEPFIDLLIEARWPTGRMLRSYTALVDLPVYEDAPTEPVNAGRSVAAAKATAAPSQSAPAISATEPEQPQADEPAPKESAAKESVAEEPASTSRPAPRTAYTESGDYLTQRNDTLWGIARDLSDEPDISINQAMIALQEVNPEAFTGGNINRLKAGVVMRMPTPQAIRDISASRANARVAEQNRRWQNAQLGGERIAAEPSGPAPAQRDGHLSLTSDGAGLADGDADEAVSQLRQELHARDESLELANLEKQELDERVSALQSQVEQLQRLIELKDTELAALQSELGRTDEISDEEVQQLEAELAEIQAVEDAAREELAREKVTESESKEAEDAEIAEAEPVSESEQPVFVPEEEGPVQQPGLLDRVLANPIYIGGFGLLIIAGVAGFLLRRKSLAERKVMEDNDSFDFDIQADAEDIAEEGDSHSTQGGDDLETLADEGLDTETPEDVSAETIQPEGAEPEEQTTTVQTGDAIGEAEIYIAYNQYGQAIELLKNAIKTSPQDIALKSKLIEVCVASGNKEEFQNTFLDLQAGGDQQAVAEAKELLSTNEEAADWLDDLPQAEADISTGSDDALLDNNEVLDLDDDLDLDIDDEGFDGELEDSFMTHDSQSLEEDLSLDLDAEDNDNAASEAQDDGSFDLSADLESDLSDDLGELDLGDADDELQLDSLENELDSETESEEPLSQDQSLTNADEEELSLDMNDLAGDDAAVEEQDEVLSPDSLSAEAEQEDDLSLDLSSFDETRFEESSADEPAASGETDEDILEFDGLDLETSVDDSDELNLDSATADDEISLELPEQEQDAESALTEDGDALEDVSLDDLDFAETDGQTSGDDRQMSGETEEEEGETLSLSDFDLDFDDLDEASEAAPEQFEQPESSVEEAQDDQTIVRDAVSLDEDEPVDTPSSEQQSPQTQIEPIDEDHVSSPLESLEEDDLTFLSDADEVSTKLDLAQAYIDMGDVDGAREILLEVVKEGGEEQKTEAAALLDSLE